MGVIYVVKMDFLEVIYCLIESINIYEKLWVGLKDEYKLLLDDNIIISYRMFCFL